MSKVTIKFFAKNQNQYVTAKDMDFDDLVVDADGDVYAVSLGDVGKCYATEDEVYSYLHGIEPHFFVNGERIA
ncbi:hypothetical protein MMG00_12100 [Ignatzschineria rhizosphaerae]|uniref:Uncharacterized protein n=1 Tax=Ignatzschineria rhizosphaerae TaxID=2923279 RepID=A0ABY3X394_9GAMM|nr:hypothetical protein [Ignatzschineria rhizosphaerae]UNM95927.1 hypothetical protein MMG00_12100 [Ignatzschineria rhizosphaerae]